MEIYVYPIIALLFVGIFTREVIAPASRNHCDRRWLIMASSLGAGTVVITLLIGYVMADVIRENALFNTSGMWGGVLGGYVRRLAGAAAQLPITFTAQVCHYRQ